MGLISLSGLHGTNTIRVSWITIATPSHIHGILADATFKVQRLLPLHPPKLSVSQIFNQPIIQKLYNMKEIKSLPLIIINSSLETTAIISALWKMISIFLMFQK